MSGPVESAVRGMITPGARLHTAAAGSPFAFGAIDEDGVVLVLGKGRWPVRLTWDCLEGVLPFLYDRGWIRIGAAFSSPANHETLDGYLKHCTRTATAGWVAALLDHVAFVELDSRRPARVRSRADFDK